MFGLGLKLYRGGIELPLRKQLIVQLEVVPDAKYFIAGKKTWVDMKNPCKHHTKAQIWYACQELAMCLYIIDHHLAFKVLVVRIHSF